MSETALIATALLMGLAGNVHCLGMCGGIMAALGMRPEKPGFALVACYNAGRITSYALAGGLLGGLLATVGQHVPATGPVLRIMAGLLLVAMGVYLAGWANGLLPLERLGQQLWKRLPHPSLAKLRNGEYLGAFGTGMIWGWLPCGLVYSTLAWASVQGSASLSVWLMLAFGIGTLPAMLATGMFASRLRRYLQHRGLRTAAGIMVIVFGVWTLAMPLWPSHPHDAGSPAHGHHHPANPDNGQ